MAKGRKTKGSVSMVKVNLKNFSEVRQRLAVIEEIEETININLKRAERLRQAILKKAFSGRLVSSPQDRERANV